MPLSPLTGLLLSLWLADPFSYSFNRQTNEKGEAEVVLTANDNMEALEVTINGDKQTIRKQVPALKAGKSFTIRWIQNAPQSAYTMKILGSNTEAEASFEVVRPSAAKTVAGGKLEALSSREDLLERRQSSYRVPFDVESYEFQVYNSDGKVIFDDAGRGSAKAGERMTLRWSAEDEVFLIKFSIVGPQGQTAEYSLCPYSVEIPHTDVVFDSGKAVIRGDQEARVSEAAIIAMHELDALEKVNKAVNANLTAQLYIVGYTDTVGGAADNKKLSDARARAIAEYFRKKGVWCEIHYAGMGEQGLKVQTADNVDEERNRRAAYILTFQKPAAGGAIPSQWKKSADASARPGGALPPYPEKYLAERERRKKGGGSGSGGGSGASESGSGSGDGGSAGDEGTSGGHSIYDVPGGGGGGGSSVSERDDGSVGSHNSGPDPVGGTPGASSKGCSIGEPSGGAAAVTLWAGLWALGRRRRG